MKSASWSKACANLALWALAPCQVAKQWATCSAVWTFTKPSRSCCFHTGCCSGAKYAMANTQSVSSSPNKAGTACGKCWAAKRSQATSSRLRLTGASHNAATLSCGRARLRQKLCVGVSTRTMSEDTPPVKGVKVTSSWGSSRPMRCRGAISSGWGSDKGTSLTKRRRIFEARDAAQTAAPPTGIAHLQRTKVFCPLTYGR